MKPAAWVIGCGMTVPASPSAFAELEDDLVSGRLTEALADIAEEAAQLILPYWRAGTTAPSPPQTAPPRR